eukprot:gene39298-48556_t
MKRSPMHRNLSFRGVGSGASSGGRYISSGSDTGCNSDYISATSTVDENIEEVSNHLTSMFAKSPRVRNKIIFSTVTEESTSTTSSSKHTTTSSSKHHSHSASHDITSEFSSMHNTEITNVTNYHDTSSEAGTPKASHFDSLFNTHSGVETENTQHVHHVSDGNVHFGATHFNHMSSNNSVSSSDGSCSSSTFNSPSRVSRSLKTSSSNKVHSASTTTVGNLTKVFSPLAHTSSYTSGSVHSTQSPATPVMHEGNHCQHCETCKNLAVLTASFNQEQLLRQQRRLEKKASKAAMLAAAAASKQGAPHTPNLHSVSRSGANSPALIRHSTGGSSPAVSSRVTNGAQSPALLRHSTGSLSPAVTRAGARSPGASAFGHTTHTPPPFSVRSATGANSPGISGASSGSVRSSHSPALTLQSVRRTSHTSATSVTTENNTGEDSPVRTPSKVATPPLTGGSSAKRRSAIVKSPL